MKQDLRRIQFAVLILFMALSLMIASLTLTRTVSASGAADPLPSWRNGPSKQAILQFVQRVTDKSSPDYVPPADRIATFDNDGTLWSERPVYFQLLFAIDRVKALAPKHPEWKTKQPFKAVLDNDLKALAASGEKGLLDLVMATHSGMTISEFESIVKEWIKTASVSLLHATEQDGVSG